MKRAALSVLLGVLFGSVLLWARDDHMVNAAIVPGARGIVHTDTDRNGNTGIKVSVEHLAKPHDLQPGYSTYVVWVQPRGQSPINVGELRVNDDLQGSLQATTPYKAFDIFITAENDPRAAAPTGPEVLHATVNRD